MIQFNQKLIKINILKGSMKFKKKNYTSQVDEMDCGCAALSMILKSYGTEKSLASLRLLAGTTIEGTSALGIKKQEKG